MVLYSMDRTLRRLPASFYRSDSGREPVREWLKGLEPEDRKAIGEDIQEAELSWRGGMTRVRSLGGELWEVRSRLPGRRIARVLFCLEHGRMVLLHGFIKKFQKTTRHDIDLALKRRTGVGT